MGLETHPLGMREVVVESSFLISSWNADEPYEIPPTAYLMAGDHLEGVRR